MSDKVSIWTNVWTEIGYVDNEGFAQQIASEIDEELIHTQGFGSSITFTVDEVDWYAFERLMRLSGYRRETPYRSRMHAAYRAKTRRRGRK